MRDKLGRELIAVARQLHDEGLNSGQIAARLEESVVFGAVPVPPGWGGGRPGTPARRRAQRGGGAGAGLCPSAREPIP
jgi:hypothetical protein